MTFSVTPKPLTRATRLGRTVLKRFIYAQFSVIAGVKIAFGKDQPLVRFTVENDPPSTYWVYRLDPSRIDELREVIGLKDPWSLCPIRCLDDDEPSYVMIVNAYRVSGLANGLRAEWSVTVAQSDGVPRYHVIDARSSRTSMDPVDIITRSSPVAHERRNDVVETTIGDPGETFTSTITAASSARPVQTSAEWVTANDYIYWGNGVRDRTFYDASLAQAQQRLIDPGQVEVDDQSPWSRFLLGEPIHTLLLANRIEFVISPWENVDQAPIE